MAVDAGRSGTATLARRRPSPAAIVVCLGITLAAYAWLDHVNPPFAVTDDGVRDQLLARDCVELGDCHLIGAPTSVRGIHQGAAWIDLLVAVRFAGGTEATARAVVLGLLALSIGTLCLVIWRWLRPSLALPAAVLLLGALSYDAYPSQLINPSAAAFPDVLTAAALLCYALSGKRRYLVMTAFALGLAINFHVAAFSLVPSLVAAVGLTSRRPWHALLLAVGVLVITYVVTSRAALVANFDSLAGDGRLPFIGAALLVVALSSVWLGPWFQRLPRDRRAWGIGMILLLPFGIGTLWLTLRQGHYFGVTYLHPVLAPAATVAATLISIPFERVRYTRWIPTAVAALTFTALAVLAVLAPRHQVMQAGEQWTLTDAATIAARATRMGWSYDQLPFRLQSRNCRELLVGISAVAPPAFAASRGSRRHLQVLRVRRDRVAAFRGTDDVVALEGGDVAVVREIESWLRSEALLACRTPLGAAGASVCAPARPTAAESGGVARVSFLMRSFPEIHSLDVPPPYVETYEIPLTPAAGESRDMTIADGSPPQCRWHITRVEGVRADGALPTTHVVLHSDAGAPGRLVVERAAGTPSCPTDATARRYPPCVLEMQPGDPLGAQAGSR